MPSEGMRITQMEKGNTQVTAMASLTPLAHCVSAGEVFRHDAQSLSTSYSHTRLLMIQEVNEHLLHFQLMEDLAVVSWEEITMLNPWAHNSIQPPSLTILSSPCNGLGSMLFDLRQSWNNRVSISFFLVICSEQILSDISL